MCRPSLFERTDRACLNMKTEPVITPVTGMVELFIPGPQKIAEPPPVRARTTHAGGDGPVAQEAPRGPN